MKTLRIWFACSLAMAVTMLFNWPYGFFAVLMPMLILGKQDHFQWAPGLTLFFACVSSSLQAIFLFTTLSAFPVLLTLGVGIMLLINCIQMMSPKSYLFGFKSLLIGSAVLHYVSYASIDIEEFTINLWIITLANIAICALAYWLFPEPEADKPTQTQPVPPKKSDAQVLSQVILAWSMAMLTFFVFQIGNLNDSLSAQVSILIVLAPMTFDGSLTQIKARVMGTGLGCLAGMIVQLSLGSWFSHGLLLWFAATIAMGLFCHWQTKEPAKAALSFSAMSALIVPLTTTLTPERQDAVYAILYRFSSIFFTLLLTVVILSAIDQGLKWWFQPHQSGST